MMGKGHPSEMYAPQHPGYGGHHHHPPPHHSYPPHSYQPPIVSQPSHVQSTNVVVNGGGGGTTNVKREWSSQLCACMEDVSGCACAICFTPCLLMTLATRLEEFCFMPFCVPQALMAMRVKVRAENRIGGSICKDCVCTACCPFLVLCQLKRELDNIDLRKPKTEI